VTYTSADIVRTQRIWNTRCSEFSGQGKAQNMLFDKATKAYPNALVIGKIEPPVKGPKVYYDAADGDAPDKVVRGFGIRVTPAGARSFVLNYRTKGGQERRLTIGSWPEWSTARAREWARQLRVQIDEGRDPLAERDAERDAPTVKQLAGKYIAKHLPKKRPSSRRNDEAMLRQWIIPELGNKKVAAVRPIDIEELHAKITKAGTPIRANRVVALLSKLFALSIRWEMRSDNPVKSAVERNPETKRKVYLKPEQITRLSDALAVHPDQNVADAVRLLLLTGARRSEVLGARWDQFDLEAGKWVKPASTTKQNELHEVPLSSPALELLVRRRATVKGEYVFPGHGRPHLTEIKKSWALLREAAEGVRLHDLRHTAASIMASGGATLPMIGALLGHSQPSTTARYAHLYTDPLREAAERVGAVVIGGNSADVVNLRKGMAQSRK
jgi:integrase